MVGYDGGPLGTEIAVRSGFGSSSHHMQVGSQGLPTQATGAALMDCGLMYGRFEACSGSGCVLSSPSVHSPQRPSTQYWVPSQQVSWPFFCSSVSEQWCCAPSSQGPTSTPA